VPLIGETTLLGQKVIDLAGDAANGGARRSRRLVGGHSRAGRAGIQDPVQRRAFKYVPDHNGIKGYTGVYCGSPTRPPSLGKFDSDRKALRRLAGTA